MSTYFAILTQVGEAKLANAIALGQTLKIKKLGVGDGNGNLPVPVRTQTALVHEQRRADLNQLAVDPANSSQIIVEQVLPEDVGGWWIREIGIYDEAGDLCAVANCPPSYKPQMAEGSGRTQVVRVVLIVASTAAIELKIDPSVVLATRKYADDKIIEVVSGHEAKENPHSQYFRSRKDILPGGMAQQVLRKKSIGENDWEWADLPAGLTPSKNLADVADASTARKNIGAMPLMSGVPLMWPTLDCPNFAVVRDGSALGRLAYPVLFSILAPLRTVTITQNAAGAVVTGLPRTSDLWVGMPVENAVLPAGTSIKSIDSAGQVTLSTNSTATAANVPATFFLFGYGNGGGATTFGVMDDRGLFERALDSGRGYDSSSTSGTLTSGSNVVSAVANTRGMYIGQSVSAVGIPGSATVTGLTLTSYTISTLATASGVTPITISGRQISSEQSHSVESHDHANSYGGTMIFGGGPNVYDYQSGTNANRGYAMTKYGGPETRPRNRGYLPIIVI